MAHSNSARKRIRQNARAKARNRWRLRAMRSAIKDVNGEILHGTPESAREALRKAQAVIDRAAQRNVIHANQAARRKSRLNARVKAKFAA